MSFISRIIIFFFLINVWLTGSAKGTVPGMAGCTEALEWCKIECGDISISIEKGRGVAKISDIDGILSEAYLNKSFVDTVLVQAYQIFYAGGGFELPNILVLWLNSMRNNSGDIEFKIKMKVNESVLSYNVSVPLNDRKLFYPDKMESLCKLVNMISTAGREYRETCIEFLKKIRTEDVIPMNLYPNLPAELESWQKSMGNL